ncbi:MAG: glutamine--fructose-6-phosphate transaminase (isomerizing), partial [Bacteroidales bacterium]
MCGIIGYIGSKPARDIVINGLKRLEYRGYDSAGLALVNGETKIFKCQGRVKDLEEMVNKSSFDGTIGLGHTRWATHGEPNELNAHPQVSYKGNFVVVHNGIIENYSLLKKQLQSRGIVFASQTDTEVLANLIEHLYIEGDLTAEQAIILALNRVEGAYGLGIICTKEPDKIFAARKGSPLVIGIGDGENFIASDATPIVEYTQKVVYLNDNDVAIIKKDQITLKTLKNEVIKPHIKELDLKIGEIDKEGFAHFMLKEIFEQPRAIHDTFRGRVLPDKSGIMLGGLRDVIDTMSQAERILIVACGTSWHAGLLGEYFFEEYTRIPVEVEYASEFRYRNPIIRKGDIVIAISQSGETADTLAAVKLAKEKGAKVIGICNVVGSSIPRETDAGVYTHAGPEIGVASTKAFTTQVTVLAMMAFEIGYLKGVITAAT